MTREHVFPAWLAAYLPGEDGDRKFRASVESGGTGSTLREWSSTKLDFAAKRVCRHCNNGWMSQLEERAEPYLASMLRGSRRTYHGDGQRTLAGWATKTALALELANRDAYPPVSEQHFRAIVESEGAPIPSTQVYLGTFWRRDQLNHQLRRLTIGTGDETVPETDAFLSTFHVGGVLFQVFFHDHPRPVTFNRASGTMEWVSQIWPTTSPVAWPPKRLADDAALHQLKEALSPMREQIQVNLGAGARTQRKRR